MKSYEFALLQFMPDKLTGEFANIGIILFSEEAQSLQYHFVQSPQRISQFFGDVYSTGYAQTLKELQTYFDEVNERRAKGGSAFPSLATLLSPFSTWVDTSIGFSEVKKGVDVNLHDAFHYLKSRILDQYQPKAKPIVGISAEKFQALHVRPVSLTDEPVKPFCPAA